MQLELDRLRSSLGDVSRRCVSFFEEKPSSSSVPVLRSELNQAVEKIDQLHNLSSVFLQKLVPLFISIELKPDLYFNVRRSRVPNIGDRKLSF